MKLPKGYTVFDAAEHLNTEEDIAHFLEIASIDNDSEHIARAHVIAERARARNKKSQST